MKGILFKPEGHKAIREDKKTQTRRLGGLKTINQDPDNWNFVYQELDDFYFEPIDKHCICCVCKPLYKVGEVVYIKEAWCAARDDAPGHCTDEGVNAGNYDIVQYRDAWLKTPRPKAIVGRFSFKWRSPLFMPEWAARDFIKFIDIRAGRLQKISDEDIRAEGMGFAGMVPVQTAMLATGTNNLKDLQLVLNRAEFIGLWNSINAKPKPVKVKGVITHYESYPWEDIQEVREYRGKPWYVHGNPWVFAYAFERALIKGGEEDDQRKR